ncbi:MAG: carboxymuconolactone decarboxylase family protein [Bdellovibrionales bacterium]
MAETLTSLDDLIAAIPDYGKDIRLNLSSVLTTEGATDLQDHQIAAIALASAYATRNHELISAIKGHLRDKIDEAHVNAAKAAATIMSMNNVYYRFTHLVEDEELTKMPARLRMTIIGNPGIAKTDFELMSLAVSAINGCGKCMQAHAHEIEKQGVTKTAVQSAVRIASVISATAQALFLAQY